jgi:hypothetical protein
MQPGVALTRVLVLMVAASVACGGPTAGGVPPALFLSMTAAENAGLPALEFDRVP